MYSTDDVTAVARNGRSIMPEITDYVYDLLGNLDQVRFPGLVIGPSLPSQPSRTVLLPYFPVSPSDGHGFARR